jgi:hypothetical protein
MRKLKLILLVFFVNTALGIAFFTIDYELAYYGKNVFINNRSLPFGIVPEFRYDFEGGFGLRDKNGFSLGSKNTKYLHNDRYVVTDSLIGYCYNKYNVVLQIIDTVGVNYYISFTENKDTLSKREISISVFNKNEYIEDEQCKWVLIHNDDKRVDRLELRRNFAGLLFVAFFVIIILLIIRMKKMKRII